MPWLRFLLVLESFFLETITSSFNSGIFGEYFANFFGRHSNNFFQEVLLPRFLRLICILIPISIYTLKVKETGQPCLCTNESKFMLVASKKDVILDVKHLWMLSVKHDILLMYYQYMFYFPSYKLLIYGDYPVSLPPFFLFLIQEEGFEERQQEISLQRSPTI